MSKRIPYAEQLRDPRWQKKRLEVMNFNDWTCEECTSQKKFFHVHHRYYIPGRLAWEYPLQSYACVCEGCHKEIHEQMSSDEKITEYEWERILNLLNVWADGPFSLSNIADLIEKRIEDGRHAWDILNAIEVFLGEKDSVQWAFNKYWERFE